MAFGAKGAGWARPAPVADSTYAFTLRQQLPFERVRSNGDSADASGYHAMPLERTIAGLVNQGGLEDAILDIEPEPVFGAAQQTLGSRGSTRQLFEQEPLLVGSDFEQVIRNVLPELGGNARQSHGVHEFARRGNALGERRSVAIDAPGSDCQQRMEGSGAGEIFRAQIEIALGVQEVIPERERKCLATSCAIEALTRKELHMPPCVQRLSTPPTPSHS